MRIGRCVPRRVHPSHRMSNIAAARVYEDHEQKRTLLFKRIQPALHLRLSMSRSPGGAGRIETTTFIACKARALPTELRPPDGERASAPRRRRPTGPPRARWRGLARPPRTNQKTSSVGARSGTILVGLGRLERPTSPFIRGGALNHPTYRPDAGIVRTMLSEHQPPRDRFDPVS